MKLPDAHRSARLDALPLWPPLLAARGPGRSSDGHAHHAMHLVLALEGSVRVRTEGVEREARGVLTAPDVPHAIECDGAEVLIVFVDPESRVGAALRSALGGPVRVLDDEDHAALRGLDDPRRWMGPEGPAWARAVAKQLGGAEVAPPAPLHPRVRKVLHLLGEAAPDADLSLETLAEGVGLSKGRLMHAFTESIGIPLRPYVAWLKLQRAAAGIAAGLPLAAVASAAGFADAPHMTRTFRRFLGMPPTALRPTR
jgi:AraC-like DNA-binding protein